MKNRFYWTCPRCGSNLDYGEKCSCMKPKMVPVDVQRRISSLDSDRRFKNSIRMRKSGR